MKKSENEPADRAELRRRAEERLKPKGKNGPVEDQDHRTQGDMQRLIHELQVHQIELEMQNDELRATQAIIEESRSRYEDLYDFSPLGYFTFDRTGIIKGANQTGALLLGKERKALINYPLSLFMDAKSLKDFIAHLEAVFTSDTKQTCELWLKTRGGSPIPVVMESIRTKDVQGGIEQCRSALLDITKRKKLEQALRSSEERFRLTIDGSPIGIAMLTPDGKLFRVNEAFCRMLAYPEAECVELTIQDITHADDQAASREKLEMMLAGRIDHYELEKRYVRKDGGIVWGRLTTAVIKDDVGHPLHTISMIEDITERKQMEYLQNLADDVLRILNDPSTLDDSINLILTAIKREADFDAVGIRLRSGTDYPYYTQKGFPQDFMIAENSLLARDAGGGLCRNENGDISLECTCGLVISGKTDPTNPLFTEGGSFWTNNSLPLLDLTAEQEPRLHPRNTCIHHGFMSVALLPIPANRELVGLLQLNDRRKDRFTPATIQLFEGIAASIGIALMRKQAEKLLQDRTVQLENANKELESFSYSVTHDLRAPLRAIEGYSKMLLKKKAAQFDEETMRQFNLIRKSATEMNQLIDDILAFSRLGKQEVAVSKIDMAGLVEEIWAALMTINPERQISLRSDGLPPGVGDGALIRQVLSNLLSNAIKYTRNRDEVLVEVGGHADKNETVYYVKDNGAGFDMEYYSKLFGVFQRLHSAEEFEGTGVGLATVQRIIHRHGGRVWAEAEVDKGATFYFTLPNRCE
jgi:PAS domain S-box-containing protein